MIADSTKVEEVAYIGSSGQALVNWAELSFGQGLKLACSFGVEDILLIHMLKQATDSPRVFALDTGRLHEETYRTMERCREYFKIDFEIYSPNAISVQNLVSRKGPLSFYESVETAMSVAASERSSRFAGLFPMPPHG